MSYEELVIAVEDIEADIQSDDNHKFEEAKRILSEGDSTQNSDLYCRIALALCKHLGNKDANELLKYAEVAQQLALKDNSKIQLAHSFRFSGVANALLGDSVKAIDNLFESLGLFDSCREDSGVSAVSNNLGNVYSMLGNFPHALEYYQKALSIDGRLGNKRTMAGTISNIGVIYFNLANYPLALEYFQQALAINEDLGNKLWAANNLGNMGNAYYSLSENNLSQEYLLKAYDLHHEINNEHGMAAILNSLGTMYSQMEDYLPSLEYFHRSLAIEEKLGDKLGIARCIGNIGDIYAVPDFELFNPQKAEEYLLKAIHLFSDLGSKHEQAIYCRYIALFYKRVERWKDSLEQYEKFHELFAEVQSEESHRKAYQLENNRKIEEAERDRQVKLARFQEQEKILHNILPSQIADRMVSGEKTIADTHENVSVFFSDIVDFTTLSQQISAVELVGLLNGLFTQFDQLARKHGLEKIKTIGDAYMAVCGAPSPYANHAERTALFALEVAKMMKEYHTDSVGKISVRIGLHFGSVVAGIIGENKFAYDMWGDAVNTASRMESHGEAGKIHVSEAFRNALISTSLSELPIQFIPRGEMDIKGKGMMRTYFLENL
ncbi:MAG: tetratricopeptide repeat protein [Bacteroidetes bacterium]|nr:tetratricopeptide repeat protein [Bacteroidota bacterium]